VIPRPNPEARGVAPSADGTGIAWYRYGGGEATVLFVPTWNIVDARVWGHQVEALAYEATVLTYDPRGAGASGRPQQGYDFPFHAADARAVLDANGVERTSLVTASRSLNTAILLISDGPGRFDRIVAIAPYVELEPDPESSDTVWLESLRSDWAGFVVRFMRDRVFTEPDSEDVVAEVVAIALDATPEVIVTQEHELDWGRPAVLLEGISCPTLVIHGDSDASTPVSMAQAIVEVMQDARLELIPGGGHRPDIRSPQHVNPLLTSFLLTP